MLYQKRGLVPLFLCGGVVLLLWANLANAQTVDVSTLEVCSALETEALKTGLFRGDNFKAKDRGYGSATGGGS